LLGLPGKRHGFFVMAVFSIMPCLGALAIFFGFDPTVTFIEQ